MSFWGRYLWLRHELLSGSFPLWDPYVGAGQSAVADGLHQLFLLPALAVRLIGSEVLGFNLWVATPFPLAALGAWLFFRRRFGAEASALGAIAFAVSGPIVSTGNFPNLSWSAAAIPWAFWAIDRAATDAAPRHIAALAVVTALQALAGEPVTLLATLVAGLAFAAIVSPPPAAPFARRAWQLASVGAGLGLGLGVAAVQLVPLGRAAALSVRSATITKDFWSLHPLALRRDGLAPPVWQPLHGPIARVYAVAAGTEQRTGTVPVLDLFRRAAPGRRGVRPDLWRVVPVDCVLDRRGRDQPVERVRRVYPGLPVSARPPAAAAFPEVSGKVSGRLVNRDRCRSRDRMGGDGRAGTEDGVSRAHGPCAIGFPLAIGAVRVDSGRRLSVSTGDVGASDLRARAVDGRGRSGGGDRIHDAGAPACRLVLAGAVGRDRRPRIRGRANARASDGGARGVVRADCPGSGGQRVGHQSDVRPCLPRRAGVAVPHQGTPGFPLLRRRQDRRHARRVGSRCVARLPEPARTNRLREPRRAIGPGQFLPVRMAAPRAAQLRPRHPLAARIRSDDPAVLSERTARAGSAPRPNRRALPRPASTGGGRTDADGRRCRTCWSAFSSTTAATSPLV